LEFTQLLKAKPSNAHPRRAPFASLILVALAIGGLSQAQTGPVNSLPNPYRAIENWAKMPEGRTWGSASGVAVDPDGSSIWVAERCGTFAPPSLMRPDIPFACEGSNLAPILKFDASGLLVNSFGAGMLLFPHGLYVDRDSNVWVTDALGRNGKGHQVLKFSPHGKVLMTLGKAGVAGSGPDEFNSPSAVLTASNGDIFVADGHGKETNARIVKFTKDGTFIKTWGQKGTGPGDFDVPHTLGMDGRGRLFVGDRNNNRIQIFDQDGHLLDQWTQFSRPSGIYIDQNDRIYVADSESESATANHSGWKRGIRIGSARDGSVAAFIPDPVGEATGTSGAEGVAVDAIGNIYGAEVAKQRLVKYVKY
jgi:DNA-binding beta-propeller fold protein YncE